MKKIDDFVLAFLKFIFCYFLIFGQKLPSAYMNKQEINTRKANFYRLHKIKFLEFFFLIGIHSMQG